MSNKAKWIVWFVGAVWITAYLATFWTAIQRLSSSDPKYGIYLIREASALFLMYAVYRIFMYGAIVFETRSQLKGYSATGEPPTGSLGVKCQINEKRIRGVLARPDVEGSCPAWVGPAVDDILTSIDGPEQDRKCSDLLVRLYWHSAFSNDEYEKRAAANRVRLAINPWGDESAR